MSYTELESGYQDLKQANRPGFFLGHDGDIDMCGESNDGMDSDCSISSNSGKQVIVGVCAMAKKTQSKPMKEILTRLQDFEYIKMVVFEEDIILKEPVDRWPVVDCLISFHSKGFPLEKAIQYAQLRRPYVINNLHMQFDIQDRRRVYAILESEGIEIPRYAVLDRDSQDPRHHDLIESEDHVEVNGVVFNKPFVEKPVSAEDHNIYIYYPTSAGGGSQRLFRKIGSRSSVYSPESRVRKTGSFIYEDFMPTDGTDVKVYTVGPDYAHAEARKSPALDGKVERDSEGKEIRYPVILNNAEKLISRKVCLAFKQTVCGFDLLRANGKSYVCDVNGFSFVKNSNKYYDDCARILGNMILRELTPTLHIPWSVPFQLDDPPIVPTTFGKMMELRCVVAVIRHGDRTPKQKMKVEVRHPKFFQIFEKYDGYKHGHVKLKKPQQLQEILDIARALLAEIQTKAADSEIEEKQGKLEQLKSVLEMYGHFSGINRKVQMKYQPKGRPRGSSSDDGNSLKTNAPKEPSLVLILKWGGELTPAGRVQAEELGRIFRCMYPGGQGRHDYSGTQGLGLLRLHSTFRHDLKIYASDEGRVQMTAAAFAKGLLALEGELTPILVQMVKSANTNGLLDNDCDSSKYQNMAKNRLHELMQVDRDFTAEDREAINPCNSISINQALDCVKNPVKCCLHVHALIKQLLAIVYVKKEDAKTKDAILYHGETWDLMGRRWEKIEKDFSAKNQTFDISKIPDIYDCIKYDLQHNQHTLQYDQAEELYIYAKYLADIVIPQEYGLTMQEKLAIGQGICTPLLKKIKADLQRNIEEVGDESVNRLNPRYSHGVSSPGRHVRTRLYFTSESHVHSLLTVLRSGGLLDVLTDEQWRRAMDYISMVSELNYMSQIVIMLYEDPTKDPCSEERFHVELHFSPGVNCCVQKNLPPGPGFRPHSRNDSSQSKNVSPEETNPSRIDEEIDINLDEISAVPKINEDISPDDLSEIGSLPRTEHRSRHLSSKPIPIGAHHTVSGHEAMDLAKRLSQELAAQQKQTGSYEANRAASPDIEPRSRSYDQRHPKTKDENLTQTIKITVSGCSPSASSFYKIDTSTNELPLCAIDFSQNPLSPDIDGAAEASASCGCLGGPGHVGVDRRPKISPLATNERPLSCTCLATMVSAESMASLANVEHRRSLSVTSVEDFPLHSSSSAPTLMLAPANASKCEQLSKSKSHACLPARQSPRPATNRSRITFLASVTNFGSYYYQHNPPTPPSRTHPPPSANNTNNRNKFGSKTANRVTTTTTTYPNHNHNHPNHHPKASKLHKNPDTATSASSSSSASSRRQRHSIAGQMTYMKMLGFGGFGKKMATSTNSLFSTAVISGSSSAPNLREMAPSATPTEGFGDVPTIRPLETLHNALSLKQLDMFLEKMTAAPLFKTPASSPPKNPSTPMPTPAQTPVLNASDFAKPEPIKVAHCSWSMQSSIASSTEPSSPAMSDTYSHGTFSEDMLSCSFTSNDGILPLPTAEEISKLFPKLDEDLDMVHVHIDTSELDADCEADLDVFTPSIGDESRSCLSMFLDISATSTAFSVDGRDDDDEVTLSAATTPSLPPDDRELSPDSRSPSALTVQNVKKATEPISPGIQKQINLFERALSQPPPPPISPPPVCQHPRRKKFDNLESLFMTQSTSNASISFDSAGLESKPKTKSCSNLKASAQSHAHHPGALIVKQIFIDPPKKSVASFQSKTQSMDGGLVLEDEGGLAASKYYCSSGSSSPKPRFTTYKVEEGSEERK